MISHCIREAIAGGPSLKFYRSVNPLNGMVKVTFWQKSYFTSHVVHEKISDHFSSDLDALEKLLKQKSDDEVIYPFLFRCFTKETNCFTYALNMMCHVSDHNKSNDSNLAYTVMHAFQQWIGQNSISEPLTMELKAKALDSALRHKNKFLVSLVCSAYEITKECTCVHEVIQSFVAEGKHEEAALAIVVLKMQIEYPIEKILVPLVSKGSVNYLRLYVHDYPDLQMQLACHVDKALQKPQDSLHSKRRIPPSFIKKFASFVNAFKIPAEKCPNLHQIQQSNKMALLIHKKYVQHSISDENWEDTITTVILGFPNLQKKLIHKLVEISDYKMAIKMAKKFDIPSVKWPSVLLADENDWNSSDFQKQSGDNGKSETNQRTNGEMLDEEVQYLPLSLDKSKIKFIASVEEFEQCLYDLTNNYRVVGVDAEWTPSGINKNKLSLLQLAVSEKVYLVDIISLNEFLEEHHWNNLISDLFGNPNIIKLGCGLMCDVMILLRCSKGTKGQKMKFTHLLDLSILFQKLLSMCPDLVPGFVEDIHSTNNCKGLSKICHIVLGFPLDKINQVSKWDKRPLTDSQIIYSALDAYCLLQIYDRFKALALEKKLDFTKLLGIAISLSNEVPKEHRNYQMRLKWLQQDQGFDVQKAIMIRDFKVLVDVTLEELGKKLRFFGADVAFYPNVVNNDLIEAAKEEGRIILASSPLLEQFESCMLEGMYYNVPEHLRNDESIVAHIFQQFNVKVAAGAIFSHNVGSDSSYH